MIRCGDATAVSALSGGFQSSPISVRSCIVESCRDLKHDLRNRGLTQEVQASIDDLLAKALIDTEETSRSDGRSTDPAIGDLAADVLAQRWHQPKLFDICGHLGVRERQRYEMRNLWLKSRGQPTVNVPSARKIKPVSDDHVRPLLKAVRSAKTLDARQAALVRLEGMGVPALPALRGFLAAIGRQHPANADLQAVVRRLSLRIEELRFTEDSAPASEEVRKLIEAFRGKTVTGDGVVDQIVSATRNLPGGVRGIRLAWERSGNDTGVTLRARLVADKPPQRGLLPQLATHELIVLGQKPYLGATGVPGCPGRKAAVPRDAFDMFSRMVKTPLQSDPGEYLLIELSCDEAR